MAQTQICRGTATNVERGDTFIAVTYHRTQVALYQLPTHCVTLDSGGFRTATTKTRMNQFANEFCGGAFQVFQRAGDWFVSHHGKAFPFVDGMQFNI